MAAADDKTTVPDDVDAPTLSMAIKELARAATSLAVSNERMATNFLAYSQSNARRIRWVGVGMVLMLIVGAITLWGLKTVHDGQGTNGSVLVAIRAAENPNSRASKQSTDRTVGEIDVAIACIENHTNRVSEKNHDEPIEPRRPGCPADVVG